MRGKTEVAVDSGVNGMEFGIIYEMWRTFIRLCVTPVYKHVLFISGGNTNKIVICIIIKPVKNDINFYSWWNFVYSKVCHSFTSFIHQKLKNINIFFYSHKTVFKTLSLDIIALITFFPSITYLKLS